MECNPNCERKNLKTSKIVPKNRGKGNVVYEQVFVIVVVQEEGEEQSITIGVPQNRLVPGTNFRRIGGIEDYSKQGIQDKYGTHNLNKHSVTNEEASNDGLQTLTLTI